MYFKKLIKIKMKNKLIDKYDKIFIKSFKVKKEKSGYFNIDDVSKFT